jgi:hypothetical protein
MQIQHLQGFSRLGFHPSQRLTFQSGRLRPYRSELDSRGTSARGYQDGLQATSAQSRR